MKFYGSIPVYIDYNTYKFKLSKLNRFYTNTLMKVSGIFPICFEYTTCKCFLSKSNSYYGVKK